MTKAMPFVLLAFLLPVGAAFGQGWQVYRYPDMGFAAAFPVAPTVSDQNYSPDGAARMPARLYAANQGASDYRMLVADFTGAQLQDNAAIAAAVRRLGTGGTVTVDIPARVNRNYGRQISIAAPDGTRTVAAIFFADHRLYQIEGVVHPGGNSSDAVRFQQSLDFGGGYGAGGRGRRPF